MATARPTLTNGGAHGGDVVRLQVIDDILDRLDSFLDAEVHLVVLAADVRRHLSGEASHSAYKAEGHGGKNQPSEPPAGRGCPPSRWRRSGEGTAASPPWPASSGWRKPGWSPDHLRSRRPSAGAPGGAACQKKTLLPERRQPMRLWAIRRFLTAFSNRVLMFAFTVSSSKPTRTRLSRDGGARGAARAYLKAARGRCRRRRGPAPCCSGGTPPSGPTPLCRWASNQRPGSDPEGRGRGRRRPPPSSLAGSGLSNDIKGGSGERAKAPRSQARLG